MPEPHICIDCRKEPPATVRKIITDEGEPKRCTTHLRRFQTRQKQLKRASHVERTYDISAADAGALLVYQGGRCAICGTATGASKLLAVEHDHDDNWVRGRCCSTCNQFLTRQLGDSPAKALNLVQYLLGDTPYRRMLAERWIRTSYDGPIDQIRITVDPGNDVVVWFLAEGTWNSWSTTLDNLAAFAVPKGERS